MHMLNVYQVFSVRSRKAGSLHTHTIDLPTSLVKALDDGAIVR